MPQNKPPRQNESRQCHPHRFGNKQIKAGHGDNACKSKEVEAMRSEIQARLYLEHSLSYMRSRLKNTNKQINKQIIN